jgi:Ca2+-binding EF-hand superfamily protein
MNKRIAALAAAGLTLTTLIAPAFADDPQDAKDTKDTKDAHAAKLARRVDDVFARLDTDKDGKLSKAEASKGPRMSKNFDTVDADHDGFVTKAELSAAMARHHAHAKS